MVLIIEEDIFPDTSDVKRYTLSSSNGTKAILISYGATLISLSCPDNENNIEEIVLCYPTLDEIKNKPGPYFGCIPGRYANRIKEGKFQLDGQEYNLAINNGKNALHGGLEGFDKKNWSSDGFEASSSVGVIFSYVSVDGEEGYPGTLEVTITLHILVLLICFVHLP